jgi:signal transduction histidine kinase
MTAVVMNLQALPSTHAGPDRVQESITLVQRVLQQVRDLSLDLRPSMLDDLGLVPAVRWYVNRLGARTGLEIALTADLGKARLPTHLETACFRILQEALTNVVRHARARHVAVDLRRRDGELQLALRDDGIGFDVPAAWHRAGQGTSLGLLGMQERVSLAHGEIEIDSAPGCPTEIRARFPLVNSAPEQGVEDAEDETDSGAPGG